MVSESAFSKRRDMAPLCLHAFCGDVQGFEAKFWANFGDFRAQKCCDVGNMCEADMPLGALNTPLTLFFWAVKVEQKEEGTED
eukprot:15064391-Ditylum_brightwellii.AAC.1